jgi:hypothetical protein
MIQELQEYWEAIAGSTAVASTLSYFGVSTFKRIGRLEVEKADRHEVTRLIDMIDKRLEKNNDDASQSRRELHAKFDDFAKTQAQINLDMARVAGRLNGK